MRERHERGRARSGQLRPGATDTSTGGFMSETSISQIDPARQAPPATAALTAALERARAAYWSACDRHEYSEADAHAAHYRAILRRAYLGAGLDALLTRLEREHGATLQVMLEQEARIDALERSMGLGRGAL